MRFYDRGSVSGRAAGTCCQPCWIAKSIEWRRTNRARWNRSRHKARSMRVYGITGEQYEEIMRPGRCEVCGSKERVCIDHDHATGRIRGLLCHRCNRILPDGIDPKLLRRLANYLSRTRA